MFIKFVEASRNFLTGPKSFQWLNHIQYNDTRTNDTKRDNTQYNSIITVYEENIVSSFKLNLLLMIFWLNIINYNS